MAPWTDETAQTEQAETLAEEAKSLKLISFPEMDSDGLPSSYCMKVLTCIGKWQMKMHDLAAVMDPNNSTMKPFPGYFLRINFQKIICSSYIDPTRFRVKHSLWCLLTLNLCYLYNRSLASPRLVAKAKEFETSLGQKADSISESNSGGIVNGFTHKHAGCTLGSGMVSHA